MQVKARGVRMEEVKTAKRGAKMVGGLLNADACSWRQE